MTEDKSSSLDILGVKPVADAMSKVTQGSIDGAAAFLSRICLPAAEEFGLLLRDKVARFRADNAAKIARKAERILALQSEQKEVHAHPRIVGAILEQGAWTEEEEVQEMWAGMLASSCTPEGRDETNLIFTNLLAQLTTPEVRIIKRCCETAPKLTTAAGWITAESLAMEATELAEIAGHSEFHRLDLELDHLRSLELIVGGFNPDSRTADVTPTSLAINLYVRAQGFRGNPVDFYSLDHPSSSEGAKAG